MKVKNKELKLITSLVFKVALTFGLIFNLSFIAAPSLSTGRLAILLMLVFYGTDAFNLIVEFTKKFRLTLIAFLLIFPFCMFWFAVDGIDDAIMFSRALWFFMFSILGSFLYIQMCGLNFITAMAYYFSAIFLQAVAVFCSVLDPDFRNWVESTLVNAGNIDFSDGVRFSGLSNGGGAALSLQLGLGVIAALVLFTCHSNKLKKFGLIFAAILITFATIFVARTGLYISLLTMLGFIVLSKRSLLVSMILVVAIVVANFYNVPELFQDVELDDNSVQLDRTASWAFDIMLTGQSSSGNELFTELKNTRELTAIGLLVGSGKVTQQDGSNYSGHDSGYLQTFYALGLPLSILFYGGLLSIYWRMLLPLQGELKAIGLLLVSLVFIMEIKEPFIFKYTLPFFVLVYLFLSRKYFIEKSYYENNVSCQFTGNGRRGESRLDTMQCLG